MKRIAWSKEAALALRVSGGDDLHCIGLEIERGESALYQSEDGLIVLRYEPDVKELVLVLGEGKNFKTWVSIVEKLAEKWGAKSIRTHIKRPGLKRWYESLGWNEREIVMEKIL